MPVSLYVGHTQSLRVCLHGLILVVMSFEPPPISWQPGIVPRHEQLGRFAKVWSREFKP